MQEFVLDLAKAFGIGVAFALVFFGVISLIAAVIAPPNTGAPKPVATQEDVHAIRDELKALRKVIDTSPFPARPGIANPRD